MVRLVQPSCWFFQNYFFSMRYLQLVNCGRGDIVQSSDGEALIQP